MQAEKAAASGSRIPNAWREFRDGKDARAAVRDKAPADFAEVLEWEIAAILRARRKPPVCEAPASAEEAKLTGLALSGGGIRSATFNLGVLQALAELKLLRAFDYISTVSGGGYIGGWLTALIHREGKGRITPQLEAALAAESQSGGGEHPAIKFLRDYSNYLTPRLGLFSADTLTMVTTALRNIYLNLTILIALFSALLILPRLLVRFDDFVAKKVAATTFAWGRWAAADVAAGLALAAGALLIAVSLLTIGSNLQYRQTRAHPWWSREGGIVFAAVLPAFAGAHFFSLGLSLVPEWTEYPLWIWLALAAALYAIPWLLGWVWSLLHEDATASSAGEEQQSPYAPICNFAAIIAAGLFGGWLLYGFAQLMPWLQQHIGGSVLFQGEPMDLPSRGFLEAWLVVGLGTPIMIQLLSLGVVLHIGLAGRYMTEASREWLSRLGAWLLAFALVWTGVFVLLAYALPAIHAVHSRLLEAGFVGWLLSTIAGAYFGRSTNTGSPDKRSWRDYIAIVAPFIFVIGLWVMLVWGVHELLIRVTELNTACVERSDSFLDAAERQAACMYQIPTATLIAGILICAAVGVALSLRVDVNLFSLHHFYRNRLTRCYLGASIYPDRPAQPFTGFGPEDDLDLSDLIKEEAEVQRPYPIINAALNMVHGVDLGWQQRKAASFVFTPGYCGYELPARSPAGKGMPGGCYRPSEHYMEANRGVMLGSAMSVSGAAASPNMGYHTSAPLAFLMTVFNVRLGRWCGNTCKDKWQNSGPVWGLPYLLNEVFSRATRDSNFVYLSDGGHFENLGIYELVRRRCRFIVASDAGCDQKRTFEDLGNAIRKCYTDFGIEIELDVNLIGGTNQQGSRHCAVGTIDYGPGEAPGTLIYLKPSLIGNEPTDVLSYAAADPLFPHQPTSDQWFDESQFESYRKLGRHIAKIVFAQASHADQREDSGAIIDPEQLFVALKEIWHPPSGAQTASPGGEPDSYL